MRGTGAREEEQHSTTYPRHRGDEPWYLKALPSLRAELLTFPRADGGVDIYDPLLERLHELPPGAAPAPELLEGAAADAIRRAVYQSRRLDPRAPEAGAVDFPAFPSLPDWIGPPWHTQEAWRRLAEEHRAGRDVLILRGFVEEGMAARLAEELGYWVRFDTHRVSAWRATLRPAPPCRAELLATLEGPLRPLVGAVLGRALGAPVTGNAWRLDPGDTMRVHPDGRGYAATWALGLNAGWTAGDGGAIAFGEPGDTFVVRERFLPFLGDLCLFAPHATSWHAVEPPRRTRLTLSGWWPWGDQIGRAHV